MKIKTAALIGAGAVGGVYGKLLHQTYSSRFYIVTSGKRKKKLQSHGISVNDEVYFPEILDGTEGKK